MTRVTRAQCVTISRGVFAAKVSELKWPPAFWPIRLETDIGNGDTMERFVQSSAGAGYMQTTSVTIVYILNE